MLAPLRSWLSFPSDVDATHDPRPILRAGLLIIAVFIGGLGAWMAMAPLSGAVIALGVVKVDTNRKVVQHQEGGIVKTILVKPGDRVEAGQTLIELNDVQVDATLELVRAQLDSELARNARLTAERSLAQYIEYPETISSRKTEARVAELIRRENALFDVRREVLESQAALLRQQIAETEREIASRLAQDEADALAIKLQKEEVAANERLLSQGFIARTRFLGLQRAVTDYESRRGTNQAELAQARQRVSELQLRILMLRNDYSQQAEKELKESAARIFDLQERLRPFRDAAERQRIVAPVSGEVVDLRVTTNGAVIGPRDRLMDIVPANPDLVIEAQVRPEDINYVAIGAEADVRLTAFKQRITPIVPGQVVYVSADRLTDSVTNSSYYLAQVRVSAESLARSGNLVLKAGMPAEIYVKTAERTVLTYLLDPVLAYLGRGFREP